MKELSGYEFSKRMLDRFPADAVDRILAETHGETEWLEFKAGMCLLPDDERKGDKPADLYWNIAREAIALANASGGLIVIGIKDKTLEPVLLTDNDPRHVIAQKGLETYLREEVINRIFPKSRAWTGLKDGSSYEIPVSAGEFFQVRSAKCKCVDVAAILVSPMPAGELIRVIRTANGKRAEKMPIRRKGTIGEASLLETSDEFASYENGRHTRIGTLGAWWARLAPEDTDASRTSGSGYTAVGGEGAAPDRLVSQLEGRERRTEFRPGEAIGKYTVIRKLGAGGMGVVYEVEHPNLKVHRAVKVFSTDIPQADILERRFLTEGRLLARFNHPGLVRVHDLDASKKSGCLYYEMDLVLPSDKPDEKPQTLADSVGKVSDRKAAEIFGELCAALAYLHRQDVAHRDIKLENVLMDANGHPILSDFGIARIHDPELKKAVNCDVTFIRPDAAGPEVGTLHYMAPELEKSGSTANARSDAFALGVLFFRLLTGSWPTGDIETPLKKHSRFWRKTLKRLLAQNPDDRPKDLAKFAPAVRYKYPSLRHRIFIALALFGAANLLLLPCAFLDETANDAATDKESVEEGSATVSEPVEASVKEHAKPTVPNPPLVKSVSPKSAKEANFTHNEIRRAEQDLSMLLPLDSLNARTEGLATQDLSDPLAQELNALLTRFRAASETKDKYLRLGMRTDEIVASHRDLVTECAAIRRTAVTRLNARIANAEYEYALKYYTAVDRLFGCVNFANIPRPNFRPTQSR